MKNTSTQVCETSFLRNKLSTKIRLMVRVEEIKPTTTSGGILSTSGGLRSPVFPSNSISVNKIALTVSGLIV